MTRIVQPSKRSGIILLVVLGMLALFSILAMTFLLFTSQSRYASEAIARRESSSFDPQVFRERTIEQVLAGSAAPGSAFWGHDLLGDYYGYRGALSPDNPTYQISGNTVLRCLEPSAFGLGSWSAARRDAVRPMPHLGKKYVSFSTRLYLGPRFALDDHFNGRVLTFEEGPLEGLPLLIVRYFGDHRGVAGAGTDDVEDEYRLNGRIVVDVEPYLDNLITIDDEVKTLSKWLDLPSSTTQSHPAVLFYSKGANQSWGAGPDSPYYAAAVGSDDVGYKFYVNGTRLNGPGMGWMSRSGTYNLNQTARNLNATFGADASVALMGNYGSYLTTANAPNLLGDANEPFDVPDYNDWFLAHFPVDAPSTELPAPSFVRPAIINYVLNYYNAPLNSLSKPQLQTIHRMLVQCNLRPLPYNDGSVNRYENFSGGDPVLKDGIDFTASVATIAGNIQSLATALVAGPWDVDNDGDGINDSVWIDGGLPTATMPDGTRVKPMVAVRIEDLGGRIDINHAGRYADVSKDVQGPIAQALDTMTGYPSPTPETQAVGDVPSGFGYGPAEIPLGYLNGTTQVGTFPNSRVRLAWDRYDDSHGTFVPGQSGVSTQNYLLDNDLTGFFRETGRPTTHFGVSHYGSPLDVWGRGRVAIGIFGQPLFDGFSMTVTQPSSVSAAYPVNSRTLDERQNDPYEMASRYRVYLDLPYSEADLDVVLNRDESAADRLTSIIQTDLATRADIVRRGFTTRSESLELPPTTMPAEWRSSATENASTWLTNHFLRILEKGHTPSGSLNEEQMRFWSVIAPELRLGQRLNLNRPIGNGIDTDGDGVVDDPQEILAAIESFYPAIDATSGSIVNTQWTTGSGSVMPADLTPEEVSRNSRTLLARHLYCLAMFVTRDESANTAFDYRSSTTGHPATPAEYRAWRLAQWAVNVVDFRDGDSIMTGFEYDVDPYDGWDVDGNLATTNDTLPDGTTPTPRGVVWGMEAPELLLTESLNFHDRRVKDSEFDSGDMSKRLPDPATDDWGDNDDDVDQYRIPQGTTVLELFCPRSPQKFDTSSDPANPWAAPSDLYTAVDTDADSVPDTRYLNLSAKAPDNNPVWRIGITPNHSSDPTADNNDPQLSPVTRLQDPALSANDLLGAADVEQFIPKIDAASPFPYRQDPAFKFDRVIWMTSQDPTAVTLPDDSKTAGGTPKVFYSFNADTSYSPDGILLGGGQYAVIGSRTFTAIGAQNVPTPVGLNYSSYASPQSITLTPTAIETRDTTGAMITPIYSEQIRDVVGIIASAPVPATWSNAATTAPERIGVNISEPGPWETTYYPEPQYRLVGSDNTYPFDAYVDEEAPTNSLPDQPFDERSWAPLANDFTDGQRTGTRLNYKTAYLQRLADPTMPYNATTNPYMTVDWMPLDLTVFNGEEKNQQETDQAGTPGWIDPSDPNPYTSAPDERFASRYKNGVDFATYDSNGDGNINAADSVLNEGMGHNNIYSYGTRLPETTSEIALSTSNFAHDLLNSGPQDNPTAGTASSTLGYLNAAFGERWVQNPGSLSSQLLRYVGAPATRPFPWITWNNRPFASPYEIMHVPMTSSSRLMMQFSTPAMVTPARNIYDSSATTNGSPAAPQMYRGEFGHLFNYFDADPDFNNSPNFGRVLEWVGTPDPFDYRHEMIHPGHYLGPIQSAAQTWPPEVNSYPNVFDFRDLVPFEILRPPFNWKPNSGRAGKINLNTLQSRSTFLDLMQPYSTITETENDAPAFWSSYIESRRGYAIPATSTVPVSPYLDGTRPTQFAGAFKPSGFAGVGPLVINYDASTNTPSYSTTMQNGTPLSTGLLRPDPASATKPLFRRNDDDTVRAMSNTRSQFHRNLGITRLPNLTDSNSQVFAVWTTIGLFNIDSNGDPADEYGADIGEDRRYRSFYIIDRTIPVRYEPGDGESAKRAIIHSRNLD
ncbi:hypothetical protein [Rosistilla oblonga]|uniref:hypothetical protein n=1 Tax=Rosistilla oblonga TaxID=2527990 RepID=UPI003A973799